MCRQLYKIMPFEGKNVHQQQLTSRVLTASDKPSDFTALFHTRLIYHLHRAEEETEVQSSGSSSRPFPPPGHWKMETCFDCHNWRAGATGIQWVEAKDAAKHLTLDRTAPYKNKLSSSKCQQCHCSDNLVSPFPFTKEGIVNSSDIISCITLNTFEFTKLDQYDCLNLW